MNRLGFIGGSDARRIMEGDWHSLWLEKTGQQEPADLSDNLAVQIGIVTELLNQKWFDKQYESQGLQVYRMLEPWDKETGTHGSPTQEIEWNGVPLKGTIDGWVCKDSKYNQQIIECKHTYERNTMEACIKQYMPQLQFYMFTHKNAQSCFLSVIFGNRRWECVEVSRDDTYIERMMVHIKEFWQLVESNTAPDSGKQVESLSTDKILVDNMVRRDASSDNEFISRCHDYIEQEANAKSFESAKADLKAMVADNEREVYCDLLTIKRDKRGALRINVKEN
jgi:predicted phage-related endonuclease